MNIQGRGGDRAHEANTVLVRESFRAAGDASMYPEQLEEGLLPWQAKKLYFAGAPAGPGGGRGGRGGAAADAPKLTPVNTDAYDSLLGGTYAEIGSDAHSYHKCQGMAGLGGAANASSGRGGAVAAGAGADAGRGGAPAGRGGGPGGGRGYSLADTILAGQAQKQEASIFEGIDTSLTSIAQYAGTNPPRALTEQLTDILADARAAQKAFAEGNDAGTMAPVEAGLTAIRTLRAQLGSR